MPRFESTVNVAIVTRFCRSEIITVTDAIVIVEYDPTNMPQPRKHCRFAVAQGQPQWRRGAYVHQIIGVAGFLYICKGSHACFSATHAIV